jgi:hypothetical protein
MIDMTRRWTLAVGVAVLVGCNRGVPPADSHAVAAAAPTPAPAAVPLLSAADVDARLRGYWQKAGVAPTGPASDAVWLRRVWIDVVGTIPPPEVAARFLAEGAGDKRARMVDELVASPRWADHWTAYWDEQWMGRDARAPDVDRGAFRSWLHEELARNAPWNEVVTRLLTATGSNSSGGPKKESEINDGTQPQPDGVNGAVNWTLKYVMNPQDMAGTASRTLLGVQIQCAECHDHKTEKWTQKDFQGFAAAFVRTRLAPLDEGNAANP